MSYGTQIKYGIARQTNAGSYVTQATSFHGIALLNESTGYEQKELISQNLIGRFDQGATYAGTGNVAGTLEFEVNPRNIGAILAAAVNGSTAGVNSGSIATYVFFPNTVDFSSTLVKNPFTIYKQWTDSNSAELFYDCQFGGLDLIFAQGQFTKCKATLAMGTRLANGVGSANIMPDASANGVLFPWNVASLSYGGTALQQYSDIQITLNENIDALFTINGTLQPFKASRKNFREITVSGTFYMTDRTMLNNFVQAVQQRLLITVTNTVAAIQSGYFNTLIVDIPQLKLTQVKPGTSGPGEVAVKFTGRGVLDPNSNYSIAYTLINSYQAGY